MGIPKWNSSKIIGRIKERHAKLEHKSLDYRSFYNGWIEGRIDMLVELREEKTEDTSENSLHKHVVTNSLPDLTLDEADVLAKETDYACYACEDVEEINWGDASAFFIEGYQYALRKFRQ